MKIDVSKILDVNTNENVIEFFRLIDGDDIKSIKVYKKHEGQVAFSYYEKRMKIEKEYKMFWTKKIKIIKEAGFYYYHDHVTCYSKEQLIDRGYRVDGNNRVYEMIKPCIQIVSNNYTDNRICDFKTDEEAILVATKLTEILKQDFIIIEK